MDNEAMRVIFPSQLRAARGLMDWSRAQCGAIVGVSAETIKNIEQGKFTPAPSTVKKILAGFAAYGVDFITQHGVALRTGAFASPVASSKAVPVVVLPAANAANAANLANSVNEAKACA